MVKIVAALALALLFIAQGALAQGENNPLAAAMARNPARFEAWMNDPVAGFGGPEGLTSTGPEEHVALERAGAWATALVRPPAMDLDADANVAVTVDEGRAAVLRTDKAA